MRDTADSNFNVIYENLLKQARLLWPGIDCRAAPIIQRNVQQMKSEIEDEITLSLTTLDFPEETLRFILERLNIRVEFGLKDQP